MAESNKGDVVITGIGLMTPIGTDLDTFWKNLSEGRHGFGPPELLGSNCTPGGIAGEISDFTESAARKTYLKPVRKQVKVMCREIQLGVAAALEALKDAGIEAGTVVPERIGVEFGANLMSSPPEVMVDAAMACVAADNPNGFQYSKWGQQEDSRFQGMEPLWLLKYLPNMPGCHIGIAIDARGPNNSLTQEEASGGLAIAEACGIIRRGRADVMITGTTGTRLTPVKAGQHQHWDILAEGDADSLCRPLDQSRSGEVLAEAACTLILESREHAEKRGARIYGSILSTAASCVMDEDGGETKAVEQAATTALEKAGLSFADLGHVSACASGHPVRDASEAKALHQLQSESAIRVPVTALKSYMGSSGSGSGLVELAGSLLAVANNQLPATLNFQSADDDIDIDVVHEGGVAPANKIFLKTSVTRMGQCSAVVVGE